MQVRRPLCLFSFIYVLLVMISIYRYGANKPPEEEIPAEGEQIIVTGIVKNKEYRVMYGEKVPVLYVAGVIDKDDRQVMCYMKDAERKILPRMGETVKVSGKVSYFREASNPGEFDLKEYYRILNVSYKLNQTEILKRSGTYFPLQEKLFQLKYACCNILDRIYPEKEASVLKAMLFGEKNGLEEEMKELYQLNGLIHILAISGLHVSLLGTTLYSVLKKCGAPLWFRSPAAIAFMWCYGVMTGMGVSTKRAVFMFAMHLAAELFHRTYDMLTAMSFSAVIILMEQPLFVRHSGFLLSFGAVLGIGIVLPWWKEMLKQLAEQFTGGMGRNAADGQLKRFDGTVRRLRERLTDMVVEGICLSSAVTLTTLPILSYFYYKYPVYSTVLNLYVIPLMGVVFAAGMLSVAAGFLLPWAGALVGMVSRFILWIYEVSCTETLKLSGAVKIIGQPEVWQIVTYYVVLFLLIFLHSLSEERRENIALPAFSQWLAVLGIVWILLIRFYSGFSVSFLDVGQGDCIVMRNENGKCYMVDGGSTSKSEVGKYSILPFLEKNGIGELEAVFLTHPDEDHISGVMELMEQSGYGVRMKSLILPEVSKEMKEEKLYELRKKAAAYGIPLYYIGRGDVLRDDKLKFSCLGPEKGLATDEVNEMSIVLYTEYEEFKMLLTGDVTGEPEKELISELEKRERLTVLKAAHHGSKYSTPSELLQMTDPVYTIISAGRDNRYGHPHEELMERLKEQGCRIYQTPESGAVTMRVRNGRIKVEEFCGK